MIGRTLSHYVVEEQIGEGGMGTVYLAHDRTLGRKVAIKVLAGAALADPAFAARLLREARAASRLSHPNIVTVHEIAHDDGRDFIVMEHVAGEPLSARIPPGGLPLPEVLALGRQIAAAVAAAHRAGVVHRDLKPGNVIVQPDGRAKVLDFGLARIAAPAEAGSPSQPATVTGLTTPGLILGTVGYMPPEQIEGRATDARSDVFALGIVLFEMLTGRRPFEGATDWEVLAATMHGAPPAVTKLRPETPPPLAAIVARCLARKPEDRYASATELEVALEQVAAPAAAPDARRSRALLAGVLALAALLVLLAGWLVLRESQRRWATGKAVDELEAHANQGEYAAAYRVGRRALRIAPDDSRLRQAWASLTVPMSVRSEPPGTDVDFRGYLEPASEWVRVGRTPLADVPVPLGLLRWRITRPGYDTLEVSRAFETDFHLVRSGTAPPGMVYVPRGTFELESGNEVELPEYWLDRCEVTNRQYKAFVDAGGYRRPEFWNQPFVRDARTLPFAQAMALLRDATGRPGPAGWELGTYPDGHDDDPVGGVSWYEAAAYAAWAGKQLPTVYHWYQASGAFGTVSDVTMRSNFSGRGPVRVGSTGGLGPFGTYDMAGNVKEWCWNETSHERRYILGGGWNEPQYMYHDEDAQATFERRPTFGFRCMRQASPVAPRLLADIPSLERDMSKLTPVGDEVYRAYHQLYDYDPAPLDVRRERVDDANPAWREEVVTVRAAYGNERLPIHVFLPRSSRPPWQTIVFFPGSNANLTRYSHTLSLHLVDYLVRSGRALLYPIYQGTYERRAPGGYGPNALREMLIQRGLDLRRALDYVDSRRDLDSSRVAFYGLSLGAQLGPVFMAIEPRLKTGVFFSGGFETWTIPPECDPVNFAPRVRAPALMVNGREDFDLPYATAQVPMFRMLGTPPAEKRHVVLPGGHIPTHPQQAIAVVLDWLDDHLGRVK